MINEVASDESGLRRVLTQPHFDAQKFVRHKIREGNEAVEGMVTKLSHMSELTSSKIKQAIFENYKLFIEAGKTATELEATMHQIHSDFTEKQMVMNALVQLFLFNEALPGQSDKPKPEPTIVMDDKQNFIHVNSEFAGAPVQNLFPLVQGASQVLNDDLSRTVIYDGELRELSIDTQSIICVARLFLLNDLLLIAYKQPPGSTSACQYRVQTLYSLENVSLLNVAARDRRHAPPNAFKITVCAITRMFQADSASLTQLWTRLLEDATRSFLSSQSNQLQADPMNSVDEPHNADGFQKLGLSHTTVEPPSVVQPPSFAIPPASASADAVREAFKAIASTLPECADLLIPPSESPKDLPPGRKNPFGASVPGDSRNSKDPNAWLWDVPEDLDVALSERDFTRATQLLVKARRRLDRLLHNMKKTADTTDSRESVLNSAEETFDTKPRSSWVGLSNRINQNEISLCDALQYELLTAADRHDASQSVTGAVLNLGLLGKPTLAAQLFLLYRSKLITKALTLDVRQEGNQLVYLNRLAFTFRLQLIETAVDWYKTVVNPLVEQTDQQRSSKRETKNSACENLFSLRFCSWVLEETAKFSEQLRLLLLDSRSISFHTISLAAQQITAHADKLTKLLGVDVRSVIHQNLLPTWRKAAETQARILKDSVEQRAKEECWDPLSSKLSEEQKNELREMHLLKLPFIDPDPPLTIGSFYLTRSLYHFVQSGRRLECEDIEPTLVRCMVNVLRAELKIYKSSLTDPDLVAKRPLILGNLEFLSMQVIPTFFKWVNAPCYQEVQDVMVDFQTLLSCAQS